MKKLVLFLSLGFLSCELAEDLNFESTFELTYWIDARLGQCQNQPTNECFRVQIGNSFDPDKPWNVINHEIIDFEYAPGYIYELLVRVNTYPQPQSNGAYSQYTLIRIQSKNEVQSSTNREVHLMWIHHQTKECIGVGPQNCLLVQYGETVNENGWQLFYGHIHGLQPKRGYRYKIKYFTEKVENPPADASSIQYYLIKVISKERIS